MTVNTKKCRRKRNLIIPGFNLVLNIIQTDEIIKNLIGVSLEVLVKEFYINTVFVEIVESDENADKKWGIKSKEKTDDLLMNSLKTSNFEARSPISLRSSTSSS